MLPMIYSNPYVKVGLDIPLCNQMQTTKKKAYVDGKKCHYLYYDAGNKLHH
jgi:hypothetical protein